MFARYLLLAFVIVVFVSCPRPARICTVRAFRRRRRSTRPARIADVSRRFGFFLLIKEEYNKERSRRQHDKRGEYTADDRADIGLFAGLGVVRNSLDKVVRGDYQVFGLDYLEALILIARRDTLGNIRYLDNIAVGSRVAFAAEVGVSKRKRPLRARADGFICYIRAVELNLVQNVAAVGCKRVAHALAAFDGGDGGLVDRSALAVDYAGINVFIGRSFVGIYRADHERAEALDRSDNAVLGHDARNGLYLVYRAVGFERVVIYCKRDAGRGILKALGESETDLHITALRNILNDAAKVKIYLIRRALLYIACFEVGVSQKLILHSGGLALSGLVDYEHELTALLTGYGLAVLVFESVERHILCSDELRLAEYLHIQSAVVKYLGANYLFHLERELTRLGHFLAFLSDEVRWNEVINFAIVRVIFARRKRKCELVIFLVPYEIVDFAMLPKIAALAGYRKTDGLSVIDFYKLFAVFERALTGSNDLIIPVPLGVIFLTYGAGIKHP